MISRYLVIVLAFGVAAFQATRGAWVESGGLFALAGGLVVLRLASNQPRLKRLAYLCFALTAVSVVVVLLRRR